MLNRVITGLGLRRSKTMLSALVLSVATAAFGDPQAIRLGVVVNEGATRALEAWQPTADFLNENAEEQGLDYHFLIEPLSHRTMLDAMNARKVDLILGDSAVFVLAEVEQEARALLTIAHMWEGQTVNQTGALVFTRADQPFETLSQLAGQRIMAVAPEDFGGWELAAQEFRKRRLDPNDAFSELFFSGGNQRDVVYAVQNGLVEAGVVEAGMLEALAAAGAIDQNDFRALSPLRHDDFPYWVSTPLYPDWVLSALPDVPEPALSFAINTLLQVELGSPASKAASDAVWQAPQNYQSVHELLISLRARPYENYFRTAANRIFAEYRWTIIGFALFIIISLTLLSCEAYRYARLAEERKNVLRSEAKSKKFYRRAIEDHTVFCMLTRDGRISHVNNHFASLIERPRSTMIDQPLSEFLTEPEQKLLAYEILWSMSVGVPWSGALKLRKADGSLAWVQSSFIPVSNMSEDLSEIAIVATDVTKTREGISEEKFQNTLELIQDQVVVLKPGTMEILYCNDAARRLFAETRNMTDWKGMTAADYLSEEQLETLMMRAEAIEQGPQRRVTWEAEASNGITFEISFEYVQPDEDEPRFIAVYRDISERKVAEKAKADFIATVSHELRTPLTSMKGALGLSLSGAVGEMPEKMNKLVTMAASNCDRLVVLINDILDLEKIEQGKMDFSMEVYDLVETLDAAMEANQFYAEKFGVSFRSKIIGDAGSHLTLGDKVRLRQVMDNLMSNAAKFSHKGSEILVTLKHHNDGLRVTVRDFGSGIPASAQPKIFGKFSQADSSDTRSKGGTGLGLSIAKQIVESHKGRIFFFSEEEVGTEFFVDLPRAEGEQVVPLPRVSADEPLVTDFSDLIEETAEIELGDEGLAAMSAFKEHVRRKVVELEAEEGQVNALQVVNGRRIANRSSVLTQMTGMDRTLMTALLDREAITNRQISIIDMTATAEQVQDSNGIDGFKADLLGTWMRDDAAGHGADSKAVVIMPEGDAATQLQDKGHVVVADSEQAFAALETEDCDMVVYVQSRQTPARATLYPLSNGKLPAGMPITILATHVIEPEAERGVVSKFASGGGGGRGRNRRRSA